MNRKDSDDGQDQPPAGTAPSRDVAFSPSVKTVQTARDSRGLYAHVEARGGFPQGGAEIEAFLTRKWARELDFRLIKELWAFAGNRVAVRFTYEYHYDSGQWFRTYGNENWEFDAEGLMAPGYASINECPIEFV